MGWGGLKAEIYMEKYVVVDRDRGLLLRFGHMERIPLTKLTNKIYQGETIGKKRAGERWPQKTRVTGDLQLLMTQKRSTMVRVRAEWEMRARTKRRDVEEKNVAC